jgi:anti-sigma factor RsiW
MMTCKEMVELVTLYLEGALPPEERALFERHMGLCHGCEAYIEQMRQTIYLAGRINAESIPDHVEIDLLNAFREWKSQR